MIGAKQLVDIAGKHVLVAGDRKVMTGAKLLVTTSFENELVERPERVVMASPVNDLALRDVAGDRSAP